MFLTFLLRLLKDKRRPVCNFAKIRFLLKTQTKVCRNIVIRIFGAMLGLQRLCTHLLYRRRMPFSSRAAIAVSTTPSQQGTTPAASSDTSELSAETEQKKSKSRLVEVAFQSLKEDSGPALAKSSTATSDKTATSTADSSIHNNIDIKIMNAKTINGLLSISETNTTLTRQHALKIVSILAEWSTLKRVKLADFENDQRFLRICRMLGRKNTVNNNNKNNNAADAGQSVAKGNGPKSISGFRTDDLNTVLGVAGDDEAAKLISSITLPQMVKVMTTLAQRKRRSTPLLRSLAFNISSSTEHLNLKQCADVFFAMATLNFQDSVLAAKLCADVQLALPKNKEKSSVVGSILTSLGILKYRDLDILEAMTQWMVQNSEICRPQDIDALLYSSAVLNFRSANIEDVRGKLLKTIVEQDFNKEIDWLNHIWSLALLDLVEHKQLKTVLNTEFIKKLESTKDDMTPTTKMKLLNLNAYATLLTSNFKGPLLPNDSSVYNVLMAHTKSKQVLLNGMLDALKSLLPASNHLKSLIDSRMGFLIDAYCLFDEKRNPLPLDSKSLKLTKVALMVVDFHDICHGAHRSVSGVTNLCFNLLEKSGYKVITVPFNEFNTSDKLLKRVQYLEKKFKETISNKS